MKPQGMGSLPIVYRRKIWGNIMEVFVNDSFRMNSSVLFPELIGKDFPSPFCLEKFLPKSLGNNPEGIINEDLGYVSQIFLPKTIGNDPMPCGFIYVIAPLMINIIPTTEWELPFFIPTSWAFHTHL